MQIEVPVQTIHLTESEERFIIENFASMRRKDLLESINRTRIRKMSMNTLKIRAYHLGVYETTSAYFKEHNERPVSHDKMYSKDHWLIKREFRKGTPLVNILAAVNMGKDIKVTMDELKKYIEEDVTTVDPKCNKKYEFYPEEVEYIKQHAGRISVQKIANHLNLTRSRKIASSAVLRRYMIGMGLPVNGRQLRPKSTPKPKRITNKFSEAEDRFIRDNYQGMTKNKMATHINSLRHEGSIIVTWAMIDHYTRRNGLIRNWAFKKQTPADNG